MDKVKAAWAWMADMVQKYPQTALAMLAASMAVHLLRAVF